MIEKNFVEQLLLANEKHPGVNLSARFPFHRLLAKTCPQLDLFEAVETDNVCFVNGTECDSIDKQLADLLAFDGATVVDGVSGIIRAIRYKIQPAAGGRQRPKIFVSFLEG